jgi:hypothetical protein
MSRHLFVVVHDQVAAADDDFWLTLGDATATPMGGGRPDVGDLAGPDLPR